MNVLSRQLISLPALGLLWATAGCSSTDDRATVPVPSPDASTARLCQNLHEQLPDRIDGLDREDPEPRSELTAGWGGSAIILRCGVPRPAALADPAAYGAEVDGVGWLTEEQKDGSYRFTTTLREAYIEVTFNAEHAQQGAGSLTDFAKPIKKTVPEGIAS
ncbi:DUF3515 domain-containing protein [Streptomyces cavernicola]|uniref:DUF3515 domain-containing protein n=1 Tax=Streptomyces cavernicola TaxID=3043613 RepID=A0ABT6SFQ9_9ACTN|nr:DUF3515 domain-containing protein [Streptomyces sp. B-S-A6]MDI3406121.1 DUF3515 domain-containing protein [Streptomyces sp. B-S-A6]